MNRASGGPASSTITKRTVCSAITKETSTALDAATQAELMHSLAGFDRAMTVVLITHRPELLALAERVVSLDDGTIAK